MDVVELKEVIKGYLSDKSPSHATMINGPWGSGKTTFIKDTLNDIGQKYLYISLYGVCSSNNLRDRVFTSLSSIEGVSEEEISKVGKFIKSVTSVFSDAEGGSVGAIASTIGSTIKTRILSSISKDYCLVFDDIERATIPKNQVLSFINEFIEHQGLRVILLCAEDNISENEYVKEKEKTVLFTNRISRNSRAIADIALPRDIGLPISILQSSKDELKRLLENISSENLRTIKYAMLCYSKLIDTIAQDFSLKKDDSRQIELIFPCLAFAIGHREMGISSEILEKFSGDMVGLYSKYKLHKDIDEENISKEDKQFRDFYSDIVTKDNNSINFNSVFKLICHGQIDRNTLKSDIRRWDQEPSRAIDVVIDFKVGIDDSLFHNNVSEVITGIKDKTLKIDSANELHKLVFNLHYFIDKGAFDYDLDIYEKEILGFVEHSISNHNYISYELNFLTTAPDSKFLTSIAESISTKIESQSNSNDIQEYQSHLLNSLKNNDYNIYYKKLYHHQVLPFIEIEFVENVFNEFIKANNERRRAFLKYLNDRYKSSNIMQYLGSEIPAIEKLRFQAEKESKNTCVSLKKYHLVQLIAIIDSALKLPRYKNNKEEAN